MPLPQNRLVTQTGSNMCKLSIPTIDSKVRPKATAFRNEGTINQFVICTFNSPPGDTGGSVEAKNVFPYLNSLDGANHPAVTCTGVNSLADGASAGLPSQQFVPVTQDVNNSGGFGAFGVAFIWHGSDFGGTTTIPSYAGQFSVTCVLPPQVGIKVGFSNSDEDVGT
jgi:hypothetical protein